MVILCKSDGAPVGATGIIHYQVTKKRLASDNQVTKKSK
jgi:hypothetical protein